MDPSGCTSLTHPPLLHLCHSSSLFLPLLFCVSSIHLFPSASLFPVSVPHLSSEVQEWEKVLQDCFVHRLGSECVRRGRLGRRQRWEERERDGRWLTRRWANGRESEGRWERMERIIEEKRGEGKDRTRERDRGGWEQNAVKEKEEIDDGWREEWDKNLSQRREQRYFSFFRVASNTSRLNHRCTDKLSCWLTH